MAGKSNIEWTQHTWNPIVGCSIVSPGCTNCYAMKMAARIEAMSEALYDGGKVAPPSHYAGTTKKVNGNAVWTGRLALAPERTLLEPLKRKKPTTYFVNSMGDLFHEDAPDEWIDRVFAIMALCPQHTFQVLTKRAERMREWISFDDREHFVDCEMEKIAPDHWCAREVQDFGGWPLKNVWLGVSCERQQEFDEREEHLRNTPAAARFFSLEPLLGHIDLRFGVGVPSGWPFHWVIVGGESGPKARPMHPDWARSLRDQCAAAGVAFFFKQWGEFAPSGGLLGAIEKGKRSCAIDGDGNLPPGDPATDAGCKKAFEASIGGDYVFMSALGKKAAGRLLDGREHNDFPVRNAA